MVEPTEFMGGAHVVGVGGKEVKPDPGTQSYSLWDQKQKGPSWRHRPSPDHEETCAREVCSLLRWRWRTIEGVSVEQRRLEDKPESSGTSTNSYTLH